MIILEGPDNCGKTTLMKKMIELSDGKLKEAPRFEKPYANKPEYMEKLWDVLTTPTAFNRNLIFDRLYFSELVYGPILRGGIIFTPGEKKAIDWLIRAQRPVVIICSRSDESILATFDEREQLEGVKERIKAIHDKYWDLMLNEYSNSVKLVTYNMDYYLNTEIESAARYYLRQCL